MLDHYIQLLKEGNTVAFPTETVYGLGADAWSAKAIQKVFDQKGRPADNPLIVHVCSVAMAQTFVRQISDDAQRLMDQFWPGPLTLILEKRPEVLDIITAGLPTVALRWPSHRLAQQLIEAAGPLVAPSANSSGRPSPTRAEHVKTDFGSDFPVIDGGQTNIGLESTVLDLSEKPYRIYRPGKISPKEIQRAISSPVTIADRQDDAAAKSPGTKYTHYAPDAAVRWLKTDEKPESSDTLYLLHSADAEAMPANVIAYGGDLRRMARELYDRFRQADHDNYTTIALEPFSPKETDPMIPALKNRISKAIGR